MKMANSGWLLFRCVKQLSYNRLRIHAPRIFILWFNHNPTRSLMITNRVTSYKRNKTMDSPPTTLKIQLFCEETRNLDVIDKEAAVEMAKETKKKLVLLDQMATPYPIYQLMTSKEFTEMQLEEKRKAKESGASVKPIRGKKQLKIKVNISDHDLGTKHKQIQGWIKKGQEVQIDIAASSSQSNLQDVKKILHKLIEICVDKADISIVKFTGKLLNLQVKPVTNEDGKSVVTCSDKTLKAKLDL